MADEPSTGGAITGGSWGYKGKPSSSSSGPRTSTSSSDGSTIDLSQFTIVTYQDAYDNEITSDDILSLGKGPLNPEFFTFEGKQKMEQEMQQRELERMRSQARKALEDLGLNETDINRVLNGEITVEELYEEINAEYESGNDTRMKPIVEAAVIRTLFTEDYPYKTVDDIKGRINEIDQSIAEIREKMRYDAYGYGTPSEDYKTPDGVKRLLDGKSTAEYFGLNNDNISSDKVIMCQKIGDDKFVIWDKAGGATQYIWLDGNNSSVPQYFTAEQLIGAGFYLNETHPFDPRKLDQADQAKIDELEAEKKQLEGNLKAIHEEMYGPEPEPEPEKPFYLRALATVGEFGMDVIYGIDKLGEGLVDAGAYLVAAGADAIGQSQAATDIRGFIAKDYTGDNFDALMGEGGILHGMDEASYYHHDDVVGRSMQQGWANAAKFTSYLVLALSGYGIPAAAGMGMAEGVGTGAEVTYNKYGTKQTLGNSLRVSGYGFAGMMEGYFGGQMSTSIVGTMQKGVGNTLIQSGRNVFKGLNGLRGTVYGTGQSRFVQALGTGWRCVKGAATNPMTHLTAAAIYGKDATSVLADWADTGTLDLEGVKKVGGKAALAYGTIFTTTFVGGVWAQGIKNQRIDDYYAMMKNPENYKPGVPREAIGDGGFKWGSEYGPKNNGAVPGTTQEVTLTKGDGLDRYGHEGGSFTSPVRDGKSVPYSERVLPYKEEAAGLPNNYKVTKEISTGSLNNWYSGLDPADQLGTLGGVRADCITVDGGFTVKEMQAAVAAGDMTAAEAMSHIHVNLSVTESIIQPHAMFGAGGGVFTQVELPLSISTLKGAGFLEDYFVGLDNINWMTWAAEGATQ